MDEIFLVNSSSFQDFEISSSLRAGPAATVDFSQATSFTAKGDNITQVTASFIEAGSNTTASLATLAVTASRADSAYSADALTFVPRDATYATRSIQSQNATESIHALTSDSASWAPANLNVFAGLTKNPIVVDLSGSNEVYIGTGSVNLFSNPYGTGQVLNYDIPERTFSLPASATASFIYATSNGVTASYSLTNNFNDISGIDEVLVATVYRADIDLHWMPTNEEGLALANKLNLRLVETEKFAWESGYTLYETGSLNFIVTAGQVWFGATQLSSSEFDSRLSESVAYPYHEVHWTYHSASQWTIPVEPQGKYNNFYYDNGTNLTPLSTGSYVVNYFFRILGDNTTDEDVFIVIGQNQYSSLGAAQLDTIPAGIPTVLEDVSLLVARQIIQSGSNSGLIESAFTTNFGQSLITQHNSLAGLQGGVGGEYYHFTQAEHVGTGTGVLVRKTHATMSNPQFEAATPFHVPYWSTGKTLTLTGSLQVYENQYVLINSASIDINNNPAALIVKQINPVSVNLIGGYGDIDSFLQSNLQNINAGTTASTDYVATSDLGDEYYIDMGVNSSNYALEAFSAVKGSDGYLYVASGSLVMGTITSGKVIRFHTGGATVSNVRVLITDSGLVASGSLYGTATYATSASYVSASAKITTADTASYVAIANIDGTPTSATSASFASASALAYSINFTPAVATSASYASASTVANSINFTPLSATSASYASSSDAARSITFVPETAKSASWISASAIGTPAAATSASYASASSTAYAINFVPVTSTSASWVSASAKITTADTASYVSPTVIGTPASATSASFASASAVANSISFTPLSATSASYASASATAYAINFVPTTAASASWVSASTIITTADTASYVLASNVSGKVSTATTADTASYILASNVSGKVSTAVTADTASYVLASNVSGKVATATTADTASYVLASNVSGKVSTATTADTASYVLASNVSGKVSTATTADTASYVAAANVSGKVSTAVTADTASYVAATVIGTPDSATSASYASSSTAANSITFVPTVAVSASWVSASAKITTADTASYVAGANVVGTVSSASYAPSAPSLSSSYTDIAERLNLSSSVANVVYPFILASNSGSAIKPLTDGVNLFGYNPSADLIVGAGLQGTASWATTALTSSSDTLYETASNLSYPLVMASNSGSGQRLLTEAGATPAALNPSTGLITNANLRGTASWAETGSRAISASYALTSSECTNRETAWVSGSNWTTAVVGAMAVLGMSWSMAPNEIVTINGYINCIGGGNGGMNFVISSSIPDAAKMFEVSVMGCTGAVTATSRARFPKVNVKESVAFHASAGVYANDIIMGTIVNNTTASAVYTLAANAVTNAQTNTIATGSFITINRIGFS